MRRPTRSAGLSVALALLVVSGTWGLAEAHAPMPNLKEDPGQGDETKEDEEDDGEGDDEAGEDAEKEAKKPPETDRVLAKAMKAALKGDFKAYLKTKHPEERSNKTQKQQIERFEWDRFQDHVKWYLKDDEAPKSFEVVRRDEPSDGRTRIFLQDQKHDDRMPTPVRFQKHEGDWYITSNSL